MIAAEMIRAGSPAVFRTATIGKLLRTMRAAGCGHIVEYVNGKPDVLAVDDQYINGFVAAELYLSGHTVSREWFLRRREDGLLVASTVGLAGEMLFADDLWMIENSCM
jgi:hypothetical protein